MLYAILLPGHGFRTERHLGCLEDRATSGAQTASRKPSKS